MYAQYYYIGQKLLKVGGYVDVKCGDRYSRWVLIIIIIIDMGIIIKLLSIMIHVM